MQSLVIFFDISSQDDNSIYEAYPQPTVITFVKIGLHTKVSHIIFEVHISYKDIVKSLVA